MKAIIEEISLPALKLLRVLEEVCKRENGGTGTGVFTVPQNELTEQTKYYYPKLQHMLLELEQLGVLENQGRGRYILRTPVRKWLIDTEKQKTIVPALGPNGVPLSRISPPRRGASNSTTKSSSDKTVTDKTESVASYVERTVTSVSPEVISVVDRGLKRLGTQAGKNSIYVKQCRTFAAARMREGVAPQQLLRVVGWALSRWLSGDRFPALKNLKFLWGASFPAHLTAANDGKSEEQIREYQKTPDVVLSIPLQKEIERADAERAGRDRLVQTQDQQSF